MSSEDRSELRRRMRALRRAEADRGLPSFPVTAAILDVLAGFRCIAGYHPMAGEPDILPLLAVCGARGQLTALPRFADRASPMEFAHWCHGDPLEAVSFGFSQPGPEAPPALPDCLLVPLVAFDAHGNRIGQGAGHYDRYLARHPSAHRIGIAWAFQQVDAISSESWDIPMQAVLTETDLIRIDRSE